MERSMRFWKERMKIRMNGFGTLGDSLGMGSRDAPVAVFADGDSTAEESLRCIPRTIMPYRGAISESRWGMSSAAFHPDKVPEPFLNLFYTLFA